MGESEMSDMWEIVCPDCNVELLEGEGGNLSTGPDSIPIMYCPECEYVITEDDFDEYEE